MRTTISEPDNQIVLDLLSRDFTAAEPNTRYVGDITYLPCGPDGFLYLSTVIDCFSRRLVGWSIADDMHTGLVADALLAAARQRGSLSGAVFHGDHYTSKGYAALYKSPLAGAHGWPDASQALRGVFAWITRYNTRRRHSTCGYRSPVDCENARHKATLALAA